MNSKEALEKWFNTISTQDKIRWEENYKLINKDLEVLDILKKNIFVADNMIYATPNELNNDDYNKLKEWYENEQKRKI